MSIEIVEPDAIEKEPKPAPKADDPGEARAEPREGAKRLVNIDAKLDRSLTKLEQQIDRLHALNARLFGAGKATTENQKGNGTGRTNGVIPVLDEKTAQFDALLEKLEAEVRAVDTLA